jgi:pimeloyl-ACP methyl ester carboxylesterase
MSRLRWAISAGALLLAALAGVELHYFNVGLKLCHPPRKLIKEPERRDARARLPTLRDVSFQSTDGLTLRGYYVPSVNGATVVFGHGLGENRLHFLPDAEMLARHGYGALLFDWRAHGESDGQASTWGDREQGDFAAAVDFASRQADVLEGRIAALGFSVGASTVALEAARDQRVRAVILEAVYTSLRDEMRIRMGSRGPLSYIPAVLAMRYAGIDFSHIRPIDHVTEIHPRPLLEITGRDDFDTPVPVAMRVFDAAAEPKRIWVVEGAGHGEYEKVAPAEFEAVLIAFLNDAFFR